MKKTLNLTHQGVTKLKHFFELRGGAKTEVSRKNFELQFDNGENPKFLFF